MSKILTKAKGCLVALCSVLTSRTAILIYSLMVTCYEMEVEFTAYPWYQYIAFSIHILFWYSVMRMTVKSLIFTILVFLPLALDFLIFDYARVYFHADIATVIDTAFDATVNQVGMYTNSILSIRVLGIILFTLALPIMGRIAKVNGRKWQSLLLCVGVVVVVSILFKGPTRYYFSTYVKDIRHWESWLGEDIRKEGLYKNELFRTKVAEFRPEDLFVPFSRPILWGKAALYHYFPDEFLNSGDVESECLLRKGQKVNVVLYVVESFRRDHSPFHGYERNTLPELSKYKDNMIVLPNMESYGTHTIQSMYGMLSDANDGARRATYGSYESIFRKHGFNSVLIENNAHGQPWATRPLFRVLLKDSYDSFFLIHEDNDFPPITNEEIAKHDRNVFIIYDGSCHYPFESGENGRYGNTLLDCYDETRHFIDKAAGNFVESLKDTPSIVLFVSDHGESFGEYGRRCHGGPLFAEEQRKVFALIWYSDSYATAFPEIVQALKENAEDFCSHDYIFHTMPSLGGIHSALRKPEWDMTEPKREGKEKVRGEENAVEPADKDKEETPDQEQQTSSSSKEPLS